jgi:porphobilinogen synthase
LPHAEQCAKLGVPAVAVFPLVPRELKSADGREAVNPKGLVPRAVAALKKRFPELGVITDVALDPYTTHGHDGVIDRSGQILNDETVAILERQALVCAAAGVDIVAPSDMMDGRVRALREALDGASLAHVAILAYSAKYASVFYGPFREAADSAPQFGDRRSYQMDPGNRREALREMALDIEEGADMVMVKPAMPYLDVIVKARERFDCPLAAYQVSGEYSMIAAAAERGWLDRERAMTESLTAIRRAGADVILTYFAKDAARLLSC